MLHIFITSSLFLFLSSGLISEFILSLSFYIFAFFLEGSKL